jgi:two-component system, chemotaxis family, chemotaxis protein CheY
MSECPLIYVVDDVPTYREVVKCMLEEIGFNNFAEASDGNEAYEKLKKEPAFLVISDHMMNPATGLDPLQMIRNDSSLTKTHFIMVSAVSEQELIAKVAEHENADYLAKPLNMAKLQSCIMNVLAKMDN